MQIALEKNPKCKFTNGKKNKLNPVGERIVSYISSEELWLSIGFLWKLEVKFAFKMPAGLGLHYTAGCVLAERGPDTETRSDMDTL